MTTEYILTCLIFFTDLILAPYLLFLLVVSLAALSSRNRRRIPSKDTRSFQFLIPAHNEEQFITETVTSCLAQDYPASRFEVVVIADNCDDETVSVAGEAGGRVVERSDTSRKGKGIALAFYLDRLIESGSMDQLDAIVVIDSDTVVDAGLLRGLAARLDEGHDWIQVYDTIANRDESWRTRLMTYSFSLINGVRLLGQNVLGLSANLCGNGMCLSTNGLRRFSWIGYGLAEDLEFSWQLRVQGEWIAFAPEVSVHAKMPADGGIAATNQRRRWEFGRKHVKKRMILPLLQSKRLGILEKVGAIFDLTMPTTVQLISAVLLLIVLNITLAWRADLTHSTLARILPIFSSFSVVCLLFYGLSPFFLFPISWKVLSSFFFIPCYVAWKLFAYLGGSPRSWIRTERPRTGMPSPPQPDQEAATSRNMSRQPDREATHESSALPRSSFLAETPDQAVQNYPQPL
jgi:cellulose synthase/poly-beta-1,6-N-acetylglucosamine synthase-like glycosyltransferase